jgi:hypothetical protein
MSVIGILAADRDRAEYLRDQLNMPDAHLIRNSPVGSKALSLDVLLVDESAIPLDEQTAHRVVPLVVARAGTMYVLHRATTLSDITGI